MRSLEVLLKEEGYPVAGGVLKGAFAEKLFDKPSSDWKRPAVVVVPGGGYSFVSAREGEPVAAYFLAKGYQVFILEYLVASDGIAYPEQLIELASAVDYVKKNAKQFSVNPDEVFVVGFSAGGHLAANLAVDWQNVSQKAGVALDCEPKAFGLGYPVICSGKYAHTGSFGNLLQNYQGEEKERLREELSLEKKVSDKTPPAFVWTTAQDTCVPPQNSLLFALALADNQIPYELHIYPEGGHGSSSCDYEVNGHAPLPHLRKNAVWLEDCANFFRSYTKEPY